MNLDKEWEEIVTFNDEYFPGWRKWSIVHMSNALAGEFGEILMLLGGHIGSLCNLTKKIDGGGTSERKDLVDLAEDAQEELVDVFVYTVLAAEMLGMNREKFAQKVAVKMNINQIRMERRRLKDGQTGTR